MEMSDRTIGTSLPAAPHCPHWTLSGTFQIQTSSIYFSLSSLEIGHNEMPRVLYPLIFNDLILSLSSPPSPFLPQWPPLRPINTQPDVGFFFSWPGQWSRSNEFSQTQIRISTVQGTQGTLCILNDKSWCGSNNYNR